MKRKKEILDPLWILKRDRMDSEYFEYILMAAKQKYLEEIEKGNFNGFHEVLFHLLNLNNLILDGNMYDFKMNSTWKDPKIKKIQKELNDVYGDRTESTQTVKVAHEILKDISLSYLNTQVEIFEDHTNLFYINSDLHKLNTIFVVVHQKDDSIYDIWKLTVDGRRRMGFNYEKVESIELVEPRENDLKNKIKELNNPELKKIDSEKNVCFCSINDSKIERDVAAQIINNVLIVNKIMVKESSFNPNFLVDIYVSLWSERVLPFKLA